MIDLALLGCGGGMPMPERYLSSLLINFKGRKILIDCGEGTQVSMRSLGWGFKTIDIICITHVHGDHTFGLPGLLSTLGNSDRKDPVIIIGPIGIKEFMEGIRILVPYLPYEVKVIENPLETINISIDNNSLKIIEGELIKTLGIDLTLSTIELEHSSPCVGYSLYVKRKPKFDIDKALANEVPRKLWNSLQKNIALEYEGKLYEPSLVLGEERRGIKLSYITDTRPLDTIVDFIKESSLFICEGTYGEEEDLDKAIKNKHMTFREAGELAYKGKVQELMLTHFSPALMAPEEYKHNAMSIFENTTIGEDRLVKTLIFQD